MQVELEAVRPGECDGTDEELRLSIAILPLRLRIDQAVVDFCQARLDRQLMGACTPRSHIMCCLWELRDLSADHQCFQQRDCMNGADLLCAAKAG